MKIVVDTNTLIRGIGKVGKYFKVIERIKKKCDTIIVTTQIIKEYKGRVRIGGMTIPILQRKLDNLRELDKFKKISVSRVEFKLKNIDICKKPTDNQDFKFLKLALAEDSPYLITEDRHLLNLNPYNCKNTDLKIIRPEDYEPNLL